MKATKEQEDMLKKKIEEGASLGEIQNALQQAGLNLTYMDLRFWVDDLGLSIKEKPKAKEIIAPETKSTPSAESLPEEDDDEMSAPMENQASGNVSVTLDSVIRPGTVVSGSATFSDGTTVQWALDQNGRLGLTDAPKGYRPSQTDLMDFQTKLRELIESRGI